MRLNVVWVKSSFAGHCGVSDGVFTFSPKTGSPSFRMKAKPSRIMRIAPT